MAKEERKRGARWGEGVGFLAITALLLSIYAVASTHYVRDVWKGWQYDESEEVGEVREEIDLTNTGKRIFLATAPALEDAGNFNEHCKNQRQDVSLLGCYKDDKIYIYNVRSDELEDVKKVTAAHELLHAAWARMNRREREEVTGLLKEYENTHADWVEDELKYYGEMERMEELYTRVGTKVKDLPEELEEHYKRYFEDRARIVEFYENYQAPFDELREECLKLKQETEVLGEEIETERKAYEREFTDLQARIQDFNQCAETMGCFKSEVSFREERNKLENENYVLQRKRDELNAKIDKYNSLVVKYEENRLELGELNDKMDSKINKLDN